VCHFFDHSVYSSVLNALTGVNKLEFHDGISSKKAKLTKLLGTESFSMTFRHNIGELTGILQ